MNERKIMSFDKLKISELKDVADYFGVDVSDVKGKSAIIEAMENEGVSYEMYNTFVNAEKAEIDLPERKSAKPAPKGDVVLVRMERANPSYEIDGHVFTREHPYVAMSPEDADFIFDTQEGFRMATPKEIQEYYN